MIAIHQVDAFASELFEGNPAAVVPLPAWPSDALLQSIAAENNLAETAFIVQDGSRWEIRWFTPTVEVALCGHATLAAAHVAFAHLGVASSTIDFHTRHAGVLSVSTAGEGSLSMSFPAVPIVRVDDHSSVASALGKSPSSLWSGAYSTTEFDYMAVFESAADVIALEPLAPAFDALGSRGVVATAPGSHCDFVSRYFAPASGIPEDPVTGSTHCLMAPYWADVLERTTLTARQLSPRSGSLSCQVSGDRVFLLGKAVDYLSGHLHLNLPD